MSILGYFFVFFSQKKSGKKRFFAPKRGSKKRSNPDGFLFANLNLWRFFFSTLIWLLKNCRGGSDPVRDACTLRRNHVFPGHDFRFLPRRIWPVPRRLYPSQKSPFPNERTFGFQGSRMGISASRNNSSNFGPPQARKFRYLVLFWSVSPLEIGLSGAQNHHFFLACGGLDPT